MNRTRRATGASPVRFSGAHAPNWRQMRQLARVIDAGAVSTAQLEQLVRRRIRTGGRSNQEITVSHLTTLLRRIASGHVTRGSLCGFLLLIKIRSLRPR